MIRWIIPDLKTFQFIHAFYPHISTYIEIWSNILIEEID